MSVELYYGANFKWHMPIWEEICRAEQKYMPFLGPWPSVFSGKKSKAWKHIQIDSMLRSGFFFGIHARSRSCVLDFFSDSRIRVKGMFSIGALLSCNISHVEIRHQQKRSASCRLQQYRPKHWISHLRRISRGWADRKAFFNSVAQEAINDNPKQ